MPSLPRGVGGNDAMQSVACAGAAIRVGAPPQRFRRDNGPPRAGYAIDSPNDKISVNDMGALLRTGNLAIESK